MLKNYKIFCGKGNVDRVQRIRKLTGRWIEIIRYKNIFVSKIKISRINFYKIDQFKNRVTLKL